MVDDVVVVAAAAGDDDDDDADGMFSEAIFCPVAPVAPVRPLAPVVPGAITQLWLNPKVTGESLKHVFFIEPAMRKIFDPF